MRIEYHPALERELLEIRDYYEERSVGLGRDFVEEFDRIVLRIADAPERWRIVKGDIRRALLRRFPYVIYFRCVGSDCVRVTVVKHERRHPSLGLERR